MFKDIPGYEGRYAISEEGIVISIMEQTIILYNGNIVKGNCVRASYIDKNGYPRVSLRGSNGVSKGHGIHQLVMLTYVGPYPTKDHQINHKDWNKGNPRLSNLEYVTPKENSNNKNPLNTYPKGEKHWGYGKRGKLSKLSKPVGQYKDGILIKEYEGLAHCARETGFNASNIWCVIHGVRQSHCHGFTFKYI